MDRKEEIVKILAEQNQSHLLQFFDELSTEQQHVLISQIDELDFNLVNKLAKLLTADDEAGHYEPGTLQPIDVIELPQTDEELAYQQKAKELGEQKIAEGKVGVILVAGGQGTRLGFDGPKGTFPVGPITDRTLFQYHTEKILAYEKAYNVTIPFFIMTSELNNQDTIDFFEHHNYFGKAKESFHFFVQRMLPTMNDDGQIFLADKGDISRSPDGHGGVLTALISRGMVDKMDELGIEILYYFQVDSPLANIADPIYLGYHVLKNAEMSAKTVYKVHPQEKLGHVGLIDGKCCVVEYTELTDDEKNETKDNGKLKFGQGSIGIHVLSVAFLKRLREEGFELPYHIAHKKIPYIDEIGQIVNPESPNGYKFEQFIFDALPFAKQVMIMETDRKSDFSPIKNKEGEDSPATAKQDVSNYYAKWLEQAGIHVERNADGNVSIDIEISPLFARNPQELAEKLPDGLDTSSAILLE